jgi:hypothetical protein
VVGLFARFLVARAVKVGEAEAPDVSGAGP